MADNYFGNAGNVDPFNPALTIKTEEEDSGNHDEGDFNAFHDQIQATDPMLLWSLVRSKVSPHVSLWDFLRDKARGSDPEDSDQPCQDHHARKIQTYRLKVMLEQLGEVATEIGKLVQDCCLDAEAKDVEPKRRSGNDDEEEEHILNVNKTVSRILQNKLPNTSGKGFKIRREIPEKYSSIFHVDVNEEEEENVSKV